MKNHIEDSIQENANGTVDVDRRHGIGINDSNGRPIAEGDTVSVKVKTWYGFLEIRRGPVQFITDDRSSWGCGYAVVDPHRGTTFLSNICRSNTVIEVETPERGKEDDTALCERAM